MTLDFFYKSSNYQNLNFYNFVLIWAILYKKKSSAGRSRIKVIMGDAFVWNDEAAVPPNKINKRKRKCTKDIENYYWPSSIFMLIFYSKFTI